MIRFLLILLHETYINYMAFLREIFIQFFGRELTGEPEERPVEISRKKRHIIAVFSPEKKNTVIQVCLAHNVFYVCLGSF